jgi:hypothetical protein
MSLEFPKSSKTKHLNDRASKLLDSFKGNRISIIKSRPIDSEGAEGDIRIGATPDGNKIYAKIANQWHIFSPDASRINKQLDIINTGAHIDSTSERWIPLRNEAEETAGTNHNESIGYIFAYSGRVKKILVRSEAICGATVLKIYKAVNKTESPATVVSSTSVTMAVANTTYVFEMSGAELIGGEIISFSINAATCPDDVVFTIVIEYDI